MATRSLVEYTCDLPRHRGKPVEATHRHIAIRFGNATIEVDLCDTCFARLEETFQPLLRAGRRVSPMGPQKRAAQRVTQPSATAVSTGRRTTSNGSANSRNGHASAPPPKGAKAKKMTTTVVPPSPGTIRAWAQSNGVQVSARGAIKKEVLEQYTAAHS